MHKTTRISERVLYALTLAVTPCCIALRTWLLQNAYRVEDGFYTNDTMHTLLRCVLFGMALIAFAVGHIYIKEENCQNALPEGRILRGISMFTGSVLAGFLLYNFAKVVLPMFERPDAVNFIMSIFAAAAMLYYFTGDKKGDFRALLCVASALLLLIMVLGLYFNNTVSYINHSIVFCFAAAIFTMLAIVAEGNILLARAAYRRYLSYAPTAVVLCLSLSIPDLIFYATNRAVVLTDIYYDILLLTFGIYHLCRLTQIAARSQKEAA